MTDKKPNHSAEFEVALNRLKRMIKIKLILSWIAFLTALLFLILSFLCCTEKAGWNAGEYHTEEQADQYFKDLQDGKIAE